MSTSSYKKFNLPLSEEMHRDLFDESRRTGIPATRLARIALEDWLSQQRREHRKEEIRQFALEQAGTEYDLDPLLESAAAEELSRFDEDDRESR